MFEKTFSFWRRLVGQTPPSTDAAVQDDRRLWERFETDLDGKVQLAEQENAEKIPARIRDLSVGGANLLVDRPYQAGHMLRVELPVDDAGVRTVLACIVRVHPDKQGHWSLGCVFARELSNDDLSNLGARKEHASESDLRKWVRFSCEVKASYRRVGDPSNAAHPAQVLNLSANGIGLSVPPPLEAGSLLNIDLTAKEGGATRSILACVVHTTLRASGELAVGCNFIRELSEEELHALV